eukprot:12987-Heterococcus_DN1.PRE.3
MLTSLNGPDALNRQGSDASMDGSSHSNNSTTATATKIQSSVTTKTGTTATAIGDSKKLTDDDGSKGKIITKEAIAQGNPKLTLYLKYFRFCGGKWFAIAWLVLSFAWQALTVAQSFTLKAWINEMTAGQNNGPGFWKYVIVSIASFGALLARTVLITSGSIKASESVHDAITARVFGAPVSFFDQTPLGRIFNRFSSDIVTLDKDLMNDINTYCDMLFSVIGVVAVVAVSIPWYLQTSRQLKRLESVNRSPLYAHFSESVNGAILDVDNIDSASGGLVLTYVLQYTIAAALSLSKFADLFYVTLRFSTAVDAYTHTHNLYTTVTFTIRLHAQMEMSVNSIERLDEYCNIEQEAPAIVYSNRPPQSWPHEGAMTLRNVTLKYASSTEPVLHGISFNVPAHTSVGIAGRTGAGKSSLANALFRIVECQPGSAIEIDGVDILKIGLDDLRKKLAIIPQEPTLFQCCVHAATTSMLARAYMPFGSIADARRHSTPHGTIRSNIDPFNEYTDVQIWAALEQCHLSEFVQSTSAKLQHEITASGSNLSVGQRQLLCLARALLRQAKVILLDECTANVDYETDAAIQDTMQAGFGHCTRLCIAHRLQTVCNFDLILVLGAGKVLEYDTPIALLRNKESTFYGMCQQTGDLRNLIRLAEEAHTARESNNKAS